MELKAALTTEEPKPSGDSDGNERDISKNLKFNPVKVVKEDPERKLRLSKQLKDLKVKETTLENQLKEVSLSHLVVNERHFSHLMNCLITV